MKYGVEEAGPGGTFPHTLRKLKWDQILNVIEQLPSNL